MTLNDPSRSTAVRHLDFDARLGQMYGIWMLDMLLRLPTLGIYSFWGKTRMRRYVISSTALEGERFSYIGTGGELFKGFLKAMPFILLIYAPFIALSTVSEGLANLIFIPLVYLLYVGLYSALRYRFSRTYWRGIRGHISGSAFKFGTQAIGYLILRFLTLGIMAPHCDIATRRIIVENSWYGGCKAEFDADPKALMSVNIVTLLLFLPTLGVSRYWYRAAFNRHAFAATRIGNLRLDNDQTGKDLLANTLGNVLLLIVTLGMGAPWVLRRRHQFLVDHLRIVGDLDTSGIFQSTAPVGRSGEGLDGILGEVDVGFL